MNFILRRCLAVFLMCLLYVAWLYFAILYEVYYDISVSSPEQFQTITPPASTSPIPIDHVYAVPEWTAPEWTAPSTSASPHTDTIKPPPSTSSNPPVTGPDADRKIPLHTIALFGLCALFLLSQCVDNSNYKQQEERHKIQEEHNKKVETFMLEISKQIPQQTESLRNYVAALHYSTQTQPSMEVSLLSSKVDRLRHDFCVERDEQRQSQRQRRQRTPSPPAKTIDKDTSDDESSDDDFANDEYSVTMLNKLSHNTASKSLETTEARKDTSDDSETVVEEPPLVEQIDDGVQEDPVSLSASPDTSNEEVPPVAQTDDDDVEEDPIYLSASPDVPAEEMPPVTQTSEVDEDRDQDDNDDTSSVEIQVEETEIENEEEDDDDSTVDIQVEEEPEVEQQFQPSVRDADTFHGAQENAIVSSVDEQPEVPPAPQPAHPEVKTAEEVKTPDEVKTPEEVEIQTSENVPQPPNTDPAMVELLLHGFNAYGERHNIEKRLYDLRDTEFDRLFEELTWEFEGARDDILAGQVQSQEILQRRLEENMEVLVKAETAIADGIANREKEARDREEIVRQERTKMEITAAAYLQRIGARKDAFPLSVEALNDIDRYVDDGMISSDAQLKSALALHEEALQKAEDETTPAPQPLTMPVEQHNAVQGSAGLQEQAQPAQLASADDVQDVNGQPPNPPPAPQEPSSSEQASTASPPIQQGPESPSCLFSWPHPMQWDAKGAKAAYYNQLVAKQQSTQREKIIKRSGAEMESQRTLAQLHEINDRKDDVEAMQDARAEMGQDVEDAQVFIVDDPDREMAGNSVPHFSWEEEQENEWAGSMF